MKSKHFLLLLAAVFVILMVACPYSSQVPLSEPHVRVLNDFYGKWVLNDEYSDNPSYYIINEINGVIFEMNKFTWDSTEMYYYEETKYEGFFTDIEGTRFLNVEDITVRGTYYLYKLEQISSERFKLYEVTDNIDEKFNDSVSMYEFFEQYKDLSFFYTKDEELYIKE